MIEIKNQRYEDYMNTILDNSIDFVYIDPPFVKKDGTGEVLKGHKIHTKINLDNVNEQAFRVLKDNSFYAISGQMPSIIDWHLSALEAGFKFKIDIVWAKRNFGSPYHKIGRTKELIYIYTKGVVNFYKTKGIYEDIKIPLLITGLYNIKSLDRYIKDLKQKIKGTASNLNRNNCNNDTIYNYGKAIGDRSSDIVNFTDVWSFFPENNKNKNSNNTKHPTVKPILLLNRLIELCTPEPTKEYKPIVCDCFLGSGTTAIASVNTSRDFKGCEIDKIYYKDVAIPRVNKAIQNHNSDIFKSNEFGVLSYL